MLYKQVDRVSVSSTFVPTWAYVFLIYFEMNCLLNCLSAFKPHYCWWYIDDIFAWFSCYSIYILSKIFQTVNMLICLLQLRMKSRPDYS